MKKKGNRIEFGYRDTFDMGFTLSEIIANGVSKFKDVLKHRIDNGEIYSLPDGFDKEEWLETLDKIIFAFDKIDDFPFMEDSGINALHHEEKVNEGLELFTKHIRDLWW